MMATLVLLRHAKAEPGGPSDFDRELAPRGREQAARVASHLAEAGLVPAAVVCSAATRTRQTWAHVAAGLPGGSGIPVEYLRELYSATPDLVRETVAAHGPSAGVLLVVGHEPIMSMTAGAYADADSERAAALTVQAGLPTASMAVIDLPTWQASSGTLREVIRP